MLVSIAIAWPLAYLAGRHWLQSFAYRAQMDWLLFVQTGVLALVIASLTVSYQAIKAAVANPIDALRYE